MATVSSPGPRGGGVRSSDGPMQQATEGDRSLASCNLGSGRPLPPALRAKQSANTCGLQVRALVSSVVPVSMFQRLTQDTGGSLRARQGCGAWIAA